MGGQELHCSYVISVMASRLFDATISPIKLNRQAQIGLNFCILVMPFSIKWNFISEIKKLFYTKFGER
jgi:hypothetical protein